MTNYQKNQVRSLFMNEVRVTVDDLAKLEEDETIGKFLLYGEEYRIKQRRIRFFSEEVFNSFVEKGFYELKIEENSFKKEEVLNVFEELVKMMKGDKNCCEFDEKQLKIVEFVGNLMKSESILNSLTEKCLTQNGRFVVYDEIFNRIFRKK